MKALTERSHLNILLQVGYPQFRAHLPKQLSNSQAEIENGVAYKKKVCTCASMSRYFTCDDVTRSSYFRNSRDFLVRPISNFQLVSCNEQVTKRNSFFAKRCTSYQILVLWIVLEYQFTMSAGNRFFKVLTMKEIEDAHVNLCLNCVILPFLQVLILYFAQSTLELLKNAHIVCNTMKLSQHGYKILRGWR